MYMGFTTWSFANGDRISGEQNAQDFIFEFVRDTDCSTIAGLHFMDGIPWTAAGVQDSYLSPETLDGIYTDYQFGSTDAKKYLTGRITSSAPLSVIYMAVDCTNDDRSKMARRLGFSEDSYGAREYAFNDIGIIRAYTNYCVFALYQVYDYYTSKGYAIPKIYFNIGSEASGLRGVSVDVWNNYEVMAQSVSSYLKSYEHANSGFQDFVRGTEIMFSVVLNSPGSTAMTNLLVAIANTDGGTGGISPGNRITDYMDLVGVSTYGYLFYDDQFESSVFLAGGGTDGRDLITDNRRGNPSMLPVDWLSQIETLAPGMKYGVTETGWIGEALRRDAMIDYEPDGTPDADYLVTSNETYQNTYISMLLEEADRMDFEFVILFTAADYDAGSDYFENTLGADRDTLNTYNAWLKTGLFDLKPTMDTHTKYREFTGPLQNGIQARQAWQTWLEWL
jgi:hypothetical protein